MTADLHFHRENRTKDIITVNNKKIYIVLFQRKPTGIVWRKSVFFSSIFFFRSTSQKINFYQIWQNIQIRCNLDKFDILGTWNDSSFEKISMKNINFIISYGMMMVLVTHHVANLSRIILLLFNQMARMTQKQIQLLLMKFKFSSFIRKYHFI